MRRFVFVADEVDDGMPVNAWHEVATLATTSITDKQVGRDGTLVIFAVLLLTIDAALGTVSDKVSISISTIVSSMLIGMMMM